MYMFGKLNTKDKLIQLLKENKRIFDSFINVYLFGSMLSDKKNSNDIDLLIIYKEFSSQILYDLDIIYAFFNELSGLNIDITVLSVEEEKETKFINRLNSKYLKIK